MTKDRFCKIIRELEAGEALQHKVATAVRQYNNLIQSDCLEPFGMVISHDITVMELLEEIMGDDSETITFFCMNLDFGKGYYLGCLTENGEDIDISTPDKLYDLLIEDQKKRVKKGDNFDENC